MSPTPFHSELNSFRSAWETRVGEKTAAMIADDIEALRATGLVDRAAKAGSLFPTPKGLIDAHRRPFDLAAMIKAKPVVLTFYRGGWCPYCNLELRAYQAALTEIRAAGAELIAVSPETPDSSLSTAEKNDLSFPVISDSGGELASALGIRFNLSETVRPFYEKAGLALSDRNGDGAWALPVPATYVIHRGGRIYAAFIEPDYRKRTDPTAALAALNSMTGAEVA